MLVLSCSSLLSTGTPLWSNSCSPTPSWVLLCLKPWVFSAWWLHSLFCLLCKALRLWLWEDMPHCQQHSAVQDAFWMVQWYQLMLPSLFFFIGMSVQIASPPMYGSLRKPNKCYDSFAVLYILPCLVDKSVTDNRIKKRSSIHFVYLFISNINIGVLTQCWCFPLWKVGTLWPHTPCIPRAMFNDWGEIISLWNHSMSEVEINCQKIYILLILILFLTCLSGGMPPVYITLYEKVLKTYICQSVE